MPFTKFKGGKLPPERRMGIPALGDFLDKATAWPAVPAHGWELAVPASDLNVLGNDQYGDCGPAGAYHLLQAQAANVGQTIVPTTDQALALYTAVAGFNPSDPSTDTGVVLTDLLTYWQKTGIPYTAADGSTATDQIAGYASLDISSVAQMRYAAYTFGGLYLGLNLPAACEQNTSNWNFGPGESIAGGHCVILAGEGGAGGKIGSWGMWIPTNWEFLLSYLDEAYITVSAAFVDGASGKSPTGLDLAGLTAAMQAV